ncbi:MAG: hypothetical protein JWM40_1706, partial [Frankiales bacterium]|nr:hypothetical protein [Frankiales bacterium]
MTPGLLRRLRTSPVPGSRAGDASAEPTAARKRTILVVAYLAVVTTVAVAALAMSAGWSVLVALAAGAVVLVLSSAAAGKSLARVLSVGVVLLGLVAEEFFASGRNTTLGAALSPWYAALGFQIYEPTSLRLPAVIVVAVVVAVGVVAIPSAQPLARPYLVAAAALAVVAAVSGYLHSGVMGAARSTDFVALILAGIVVGKHLRAIDTALATKGLSVLLTVKALVAVAATAGIDVPSERFVLFYDSVTPWLASAVFLTLIVRRQSIREDVILWLPALVILALSPRRAPLLALAVALLIVGALNREGRARFRLLGLVAVGSLVIGFAGSLPGAIGERVQQALGLVTGSGGDDSTLGHLNDLVIGWQYAIQGPFWGLGPDARQLPRLAAEAQGLYVHNQLLQTWLTVGLLGAVAIAYLVGRAAVAACRALVDLRDTPVVDAVALSLLALAPINFVLFPYLDTTRRWPLLFGVALAYLAGRSVRKALSTTDSPKSAELLPRVRT